MNKRERIKRRIVKLVKQYFPELKFVGRMPGYRYCFSELCINDPVPLYRHLVVRHIRKSTRLKAFWSYSLFPKYKHATEGTGFTKSSGKLELDAVKDTDYVSYFLAIRELHDRVGCRLKEEQDQDDSVHLHLWRLYRGERCDSEPSDNLAKLCRSLVEMKGFRMAQPRALRMAGFVAELVPEGAKREEGNFSLEASRARNKLADFQLSNPQAFIVHLVSGAIAGGAEEVSIYVDSDDIVVEFGGEPLSKLELEQLFSNLLAGRASPRSRELAVALNTACSFRPKWLCLDSHHRDKAWRLEVKSEAEQVVEIPVEEREFPHRVHFRDQPSLKVFKRFLNSIRESHPEEDIVRKRCSLAPVPVLLPGGGDCRTLPIENVVSFLIWEHPEHPLPDFGLKEVQGIRGDSPVDASMVLLLGPDPEFHFQVLGLEYEPPEAFNPLSMWTLLVDNKAKRDLSFSGVLLDDKWQAKLEALKDARDRLARFTIDAYERIKEEPWEEWTQAFQRLALEGHKKAMLLPIFKTVAGGLASRTDVLNQQRILTSACDFPHPLRSGESCFLISKQSEALFEGRRLVDKTEKLKEQQIYYQKLEQWRQETPEVRLSNVSNMRFQSKSGISYGLGPRFSSTAQVSFYRENRLLRASKMKNLPRGLLVAVNDDRFDMDNQWNSLLVDEVHKSNLKSIRVEMRKFYEFLMDQGSEHSDYVLQYLLHLKICGERWESHASSVELSTATGESLTLSQYLTSEKFLAPNFKTLKPNLKKLKRATSKVLISPRQARLIRKLTQ